MDQTNYSVEWNMSASGSNVAQAGSSYIHPNHDMDLDFDFMLRTINPSDLTLTTHDNPGRSEGIMDGGQPYLEGYADALYDLPSFDSEYGQQDMSSGGTVIDFASGFPNEEFGWDQLVQTSDEPWSSQSLKTGEYSSGTATYICPPESASDQSSDGTSPLSQTSTQESAQNDSQPSIDHHGASLQTVRSGYGQLAWEEHCIEIGGLLKIDDMSQKNIEKRQRRGRIGPLPPQIAKGARIMRKKRACWFCKTHKIKCSLDTPCQPCLNSQKSSLSEGRFCCRSIFEGFGSLYFPDVLTSHLTQIKVENFVTEHVESMLDPALPVEVTCGGGFQPMQLTVHVFKPTTDELTSHHHLVHIGNSETLTSKPCAPVGLLGVDHKDLKKEFRSHIKRMVTEPGYSRLETPNDSGALGQGIRHQALSIVHRFSKLVKDPMLDRALMILAMHHVMKNIIQFTEESAKSVARASEKLLGSRFQQERYESSRLLGRQLKTTMNDLLQEETKILLERLERCLKRKEKDEWPRWFCAIIILCFATEDIQVAIDTFIVNDMLIVSDGGVFRKSHQDCWNLEDKLFHQFTQLFHEVYQTHKRCDGFNPILNNKCSASWGQATKAMLLEFNQLMEYSYYNMFNLSTLQLLDRNQFMVDNPSFIRDNPGRLASKFLLSFKDPESYASCFLG